MNMGNISEIPVVILAGGHGKRIGGGKAERQLAGVTLLNHVIARANDYSSIIGVSVRARKFSLPRQIHLLHDRAVIEGPIAGLAAALIFARNADAAHVLITPCDTPFLPNDLLRRLKDSIGSASAAMPQNAGRLHPACSLWRTDTAHRLPEYLAEGSRSLMGFAQAVGYAAVQWPVGALDPFFNINTVQDLAEAERILTLRDQGN